MAAFGSRKADRCYVTEVEAEVVGALYRKVGFEVVDEIHYELPSASAMSVLPLNLLVSGISDVYISEKMTGCYSITENLSPVRILANDVSVRFHAALIFNIITIRNDLCIRC
jgi:hypothetical protein